MPDIAHRVAARFIDARSKLAVSDKIFTDPSGNPTGPNTPWGKADRVKEIARGVRWVTTPSHGGLGVAKGVAEKLLSSAARRLGNYMGGYFWYEEDQQCILPFYEHPEWQHASGVTNGSKEKLEAEVRQAYPRYFEMLDAGVKDPPRLKPGMKLKFLRPVRWGHGWDFKEGDTVVVDSVTASSIVFYPESNTHAKFKAPMGYYYGHGFNADRTFEVVD